MGEVEVEFVGGPLCGRSVTMLLGEKPEASISAVRKETAHHYELKWMGEEYNFCYRGSNYVNRNDQ